MSRIGRRRVSGSATAGAEHWQPRRWSSAVTDGQLIAVPVDRACGDGLKLTGEGGLLQQLTKRVFAPALDSEITDHVGYDKLIPVDQRRSQERRFLPVQG
jgi:hypothetical protein